MRFELLVQGAGQHGDAIFFSFAIAHRDLGVAEVDVLHPQAHAFHQTQSRTVEEACHQKVAAFELFEQRPYLSLGQDHRHPGRALRPLHVIEPLELAPEHLLVQEENSAQGLILRRGGHLSLDGEMGEKALHLELAHGGGMTLAMKQDVAFDPIDVGLLGADAIMLEPHPLAALL